MKRERLNPNLPEMEGWLKKEYQMEEEKTVTKRTRDPKTIQRQILTNAKKYLADLADKAFQDTGEYVPPTEGEIKAECKRRWQRHLDQQKEKEDPSSYFE